MRILLIAAVLLALSAASTPADAADRSGFARAIATRLRAEKAEQPFRPQTHTTDFRGDSLGCITLTTGELRAFGYRGHAFFCEDAATGEVLGAVLSRRGVVRCLVSGDYVGDGCYAFTICDFQDSACVR